MPSYTLGLLGGFTPAVRWWWRLPKGDYAEQIAFAVPESTPDRVFTVSTTQPLWIRYLNVSEKGTLRYAHYVDTFEQYPNFCKASGIKTKQYFFLKKGIPVYIYIYIYIY